MNVYIALSTKKKSKRSGTVAEMSIEPHLRANEIRENLFSKRPLTQSELACMRLARTDSETAPLLAALINQQAEQMRVEDIGTLSLAERQLKRTLATLRRRGEGVRTGSSAYTRWEQEVRKAEDDLADILRKKLDVAAATSQKARKEQFAASKLVQDALSRARAEQDIQVEIQIKEARRETQREVREQVESKVRAEFISQQEKEDQQHREAIRTLTSEKERIAQDLVAKTRDADSSSAGLRACKQELTRKESDITARLRETSEKEGTRAKLAEAKLVKAATLIDTLASERDIAVNEFQRVKREHTECENNLDSSQRERAVLQSQFDSANDDLSRTTEKLQDLEAKIADQQRGIDILKTGVETAQSNIDECQQKEAALTAKVNTLTAQTSAQASKLRETIDAANIERREHARIFTEIETANAETNKQRRDLERHLSTANEAISATEDELDSIRAKLQEHVTEKNRLNDQLAASQEQLAALTAEVERAETHTRDLTEECEALREKLHLREQQAEECDVKTSDLGVELGRALANIESAKREVRSRETAKDRVQDQLLACAGRETNIQSELARCLGENLRIQTQTAMKASADNQLYHANLSQQQADCDRHLNELKQQFETEQKKTVSYEDELARVKAQFSETSEEYKETLSSLQRSVEDVNQANLGLNQDNRRCHTALEAQELEKVRMARELESLQKFLNQSTEEQQINRLESNRNIEACQAKVETFKTQLSACQARETGVGVDLDVCLLEKAVLGAETSRVTANVARLEREGREQLEASVLAQQSACDGRVQSLTDETERQKRQLLTAYEQALATEQVSYEEQLQRLKSQLEETLEQDKETITNLKLTEEQNSRDNLELQQHIHLCQADKTRQDQEINRQENEISRLRENKDRLADLVVKYGEEQDKNTIEYENNLGECKAALAASQRKLEARVPIMSPRIVPTGISKEEHDRVETQLRTCTSTVESLRAKLQKAKQEHQTASSELMTEIADLNRRLEAQNTLLTRQDKALRVSQAEQCSNEKEQIIALKEEVSTYSNKRQLCVRKMKGANETIQKLEEEIAQTVKKITEMEAQIEIAEKEKNYYFDYFLRSIQKSAH